MNYADWAPVYAAILEDFGYDRAADEAARNQLANLAEPFDESRLEAVFDGATVAVCGAGPTLPEELDVVREAEVVVAASTAADVLLEAGVDVDLQVTDLDGTPATTADLAAAGTPVAVHAHGDNRAALERWVPEIRSDQLLATTQAEPAGPVRNYGGFTDGDRGAFLADHFGASELRFPGWSFDDPDLAQAKAKKLTWAERLLAWLEDRRDGQFDILDGRRDAVEPVPT